MDANIVVMLGKDFPSGSHKVGPAYATLIEGCVDGEIIPGEHTILGPSTGNFGIGVAYICNLMGYKAVVIMPDNMSKERYERIRKYGAELDLTPGTESDVILTLQRTYELKKNPKNRPLAQFELMPNYRFHRHVTGNSAIEAVKGIGNGRIAAFCSAPGSAGTIAAGDAIKKAFPECKVAALEPYECSTLANGGRGQHRIEGIGDKMCTLIHNVLTTDFVALIHDDDCVKALKIIHDAPEVLVKLGRDRRDGGMHAGAVRRLGHLQYPRGHQDGQISKAGAGRQCGDDRDRRFRPVQFRAGGSGRQVSGNIGFRPGALDQGYFPWHGVRSMFMISARRTRKEQLFQQKEQDWLPFGYTQEYLDAMRSPEFWENEYRKVADYDQKIKAMR